jgi:hypothetical protein
VTTAPPISEGRICRCVTALPTRSHLTRSRLDGPCCRARLDQRCPIEFSESVFSDLIYHYTDAAGLIGIVQSQKLWLTDLGYMNDREELTYACEEMETRLERLISSLDGSETGSEDDSRVQILRSILREVSRLRVGEPLDRRAYAACFCGAGDLLSQWRGYAGGTSGFAIGFRAGAIQQATISESAESYELTQVLYGSQNAQELLDEVATHLAQHGSGHAGTAGWAQFGRILKILARIKNPGFQEEQEWRLLQVTLGEWGRLEFRPGPYGISPYLTVSFMPAAIARVVVGPGAEQRATETAVRQLLSRHLGEHGRAVPIEHSQVKYR